MKYLITIFFIMLFSLQINAKSNDAIISLAPVPLVGNILQVKLQNTKVQISTVELRNLIGRRLQIKTFPAGGELVSFTEMETYPNGLYVIIVKDSFGKIIETSKFIINK